MEVFRDLDLPIPEQVIEVPKISSTSRRTRNRRVPLSTQTAEQLVEVPEFAPFAFRFQQQIVDGPGCLQGILPVQDYLLVWEQIVDIPVPHGRGGRVVLEAFKASPWDRVQQRFEEQFTLTLQFLILHPRARLVPWMRLLQGFFRTFPQIKKAQGWVHWVRTLIHGLRRLIALETKLVSESELEEDAVTRFADAFRPLRV